MRELALCIVCVSNTCPSGVDGFIRALRDHRLPPRRVDARSSGSGGRNGGAHGGKLVFVSSTNWIVTAVLDRYESGHPAPRQGCVFRRSEILAPGHSAGRTPVARMFSDLIRIEGWRPKRTLVFAAWDGAEFGQVGSTEFVQKHAGELDQRVVAYISLDRAITGNRTLQVMGSPLLRQVLSEAAEQVPEVGTLDGDDEGGGGGQTRPDKADMSQRRTPPVGRSAPPGPLQSPPTLYASWARRGTLRPSSVRNPRPEMSPPAGGCADLLPFGQLLGTSTAHVQLVARDGRSDYPAARTAYDDLDYLTEHTDPGQNAAAALAQLVAAASLALVDSLRLPVRVTDYAEQISADFSTFQRQHGEFFRSNHLRMDVLAAAVRAFAVACKEFQDEYEGLAKDQQTFTPAVIAEHNDRVLQLERNFLLPAGYPRHPHQRHLIYGPDNEDESRGALFPHLVVAIRQARKRPISPAISYVRENHSLVLHALRSAAAVLDRSLLRASETSPQPALPLSTAQEPSHESLET
ncbi:N-acetylated-alpha-linked acidic dipeptidase protein-like [Tropilaelaps mercedesae]|uniref:N-acetylated-alpha-linked acidic dipeptidase protein-like n=1 Tax=Tropilaelaps mercedesae TaxID=418985 RepID=A0A1V9X8W3_9ACAR|nr:N-acetylated-alpha-linked acidic dipeptidase protein-like [Tropilaelaps mercedesae]